MVLPFFFSPLHRFFYVTLECVDNNNGNAKESFNNRTMTKPNGQNRTTKILTVNASHLNNKFSKIKIQMTMNLLHFFFRSFYFIHYSVSVFVRTWEIPFIRSMWIFGSTETKTKIFIEKNREIRPSDGQRKNWGKRQNRNVLMKERKKTLWEPKQVVTNLSH